jgi:hypothetical protein
MMMTMMVLMVLSWVGAMWRWAPRESESPRQLWAATLGGLEVGLHWGNESLKPKGAPQLPSMRCPGCLTRELLESDGNTLSLGRI